jgi:hypothetical protein
MLLQEEADKCRREASRFQGKPEAPFLLHLAEAFDDLAAEKHHDGARKSAPAMFHH